MNKMKSGTPTVGGLWERRTPAGIPYDTYDRISEIIRAVRVVGAGRAGVGLCRESWRGQWPVWMVMACLGLVCVEIRGAVVINELLYHASGGFEELEYVEIHNSGDRTVNMGSWKFTEGIEFEFSERSFLEAGEYLVICRNRYFYDLIYQSAAIGEYKKSLSNGGERLTLVDAAGNVVDSVEYGDAFPWPVIADGYSSSLERIHPDALSSAPSSWAASTPAEDSDGPPGGTPGKRNSVFLEEIPPAVLEVVHGSNVRNAGEEIPVTIITGGPVREGWIRWAIHNGHPGETMDPIQLERQGPQTYSGVIPGADAQSIIRFSVEVTGMNGAVRRMPHEHDLRPSYSIYVKGPMPDATVSVVNFIGMDPETIRHLDEYRRTHSDGTGGFNGRGPGPGFGRDRNGPDQELMRARSVLETFLNEDKFAVTFSELTLDGDIPTAAVLEVARVLDSGRKNARELLDRSRRSESPGELRGKFRQEAEKLLSDLARDLAAVEVVKQTRSELRRSLLENQQSQGLEQIFSAFFNIEGHWFDVLTGTSPDEGTITELRELHRMAKRHRRELLAQTNRENIRQQIARSRELMDQLVGESQTLTGNELVNPQGIPGRPFGPPQGPGRRGGGRFGSDGTDSTPVRPSGNAAFIAMSPERDEVFFADFVNITPRKSGYKVRLHKDRPYHGMTTLNYLFEREQATILNESMAYELYRLAGNATPESGYARVLMNDKPAGYHLWFEQPNGNFFSRNDIDNDGELYKVIWQGNSQPSKYTPKDLMPRREDIAWRYEKKSKEHSGFRNLTDLIENLERTEGNSVETWRVIEQHFDVDQIINYYAVNLLLSHWDGFFNNYFLYYDEGGRGKWSLYPWDQDSTWAQRGGFGDDLHRMPLNYGAADARPAGGGFSRGFGGRGGQPWWRDGDSISKPVLANAEFRRRYHQRVKELLDTVFTEQVFGPKLEKMRQELDPEVRLRAVLTDSDPDNASRILRNTTESMLNHLRMRREFLLNELAVVPDRR